MRSHSIPGADVVLVLNAEAPGGHQIVQTLVRNGCRVVVSGRHAMDLTRLLHGYGADQAVAIAADCTDPEQLRELHRRATNRFGRVTSVIDAAVRRLAPLRLAS